MKKKFKDGRLGKFIWGLGDALKGKGKAGAVVDAVFEMIPIPNPIRIAREKSTAEAINTLKKNAVVYEIAQSYAIDLDDLVSEGPKWLVPAVVIMITITLLVFVYLGVIDAVFLADFVKQLFK